MKKGKKLTLALDADEVLFPYNIYAVQELNRRGVPIKYEDITDYNLTSVPSDWRREYVRLINEETIYRMQEPYEGAVEMIDELLDVEHDLLIASAVPTGVMTLRSERLLHFFPRLNPSNIMLGTRKDLLQADILLDDALHHIRSSPARYPVVFTRPWNERAQEHLRVSSYREFIHLVETVSLAPTAAPKLYHAGQPGILCLVGPSASGKSVICDELARNPRFGIIRAITTRAPRSGELQGNEYRFVSPTEFSNCLSRGEMLESTVYCGAQYGVSREEVRRIWQEGRIAVKAMDIKGALACKREFGDRCITVFVWRSKEDIITSLLTRDIPNQDKTARLLSLDGELANESLCDWTIFNNGSLEHAVQQILQIAV